jgi:hypothetical protein
VSTSTFLAAGGAVLASGLAAYVLAKGVRSLVEMQVEAAQRKMEEERAKFAEWVRYQEGQLRQMSVLRNIAEVVHAAEEKLSRVALSNVMAGRALTFPVARPGRALTFPVARPGRRTLAAEGGPEPDKGLQPLVSALGRERAHPERVRALFQEVAEIVNTLPAEFREAAYSPYQTIVKQRDRLAARLASEERLVAEDIVMFKELVARTLDGFLNDTVAHQRRQQEMHVRLEVALNDVLLYQHLAPAAQRSRTRHGECQGASRTRHGECQGASAMDAVRYQLTTLLASGDVKLGQLELLENRLAGLKRDIGARVVNKAHRQGLSESIARNLSKLGYQALAEFPAAVEQETLEATMRIPGGEQVRIALKPDNQVSFAILHERLHGAGKLSKAELNHIRKQEGRWCADFKELVRRLVAEGFSYQIGIERPIPEQAIRIVVVETPEEILEEEARRQDDHQRRYLG